MSGGIAARANRGGFFRVFLGESGSSGNWGYSVIGDAIGEARRARAEAAAHAEVERAMAEFCAAQPNAGAGIVGCGKHP